MARPTKAHPPDAQVTVGLRMSGKLKSHLEAVAADEDRTLSAECERRLRRSLDPDLLCWDAIDAMRGIGASALRSGREKAGAATEFVVAALASGAGISREAALMGIRLAAFMAMTDTAMRTAPGTKVHIKKEDMDDIKKAIRHIEQNSVIVKEEE